MVGVIGIMFVKQFDHAECQSGEHAECVTHSVSQTVITAEEYMHAGMMPTFQITAWAKPFYIKNTPNVRGRTK